MNKKSILLIIGILLFSLVLIGSTSWWNNDWDYSKEYTNLTGNITYMEINKTVNDNAGFTDTRFISCYNDSLIFNHTLESTFDGQGLSYSSISPYDSGSLVSYYKMDGDATDSVGSNGGTVNGASVTTGKINQGYDFDGSNDYIASSSNVGNGAVSISAWFKTTDSNIMRVAETYGTTSFNSIVFETGLRLAIRDDSSATIFPTGITGYNDGDWHFVVMTNDGTTAKLYVDNVQVQSISSSGIGSQTITNADIGAYRGGSQYFDGKIDEVAIWSRALTSDEVTELYNGTKGQFRVNNLGENCTKRYYGNSEATSTSSASDVYFNPVSAYYFDSNSNDFINDNDLTSTGTTLNEGYINNSYTYAGTSASYMIKNPFNDFPSSEISISFWIKTTGSGDGIISYATTASDNNFLLFDQSN